jgi:hypothetical protein
MRVFTIQRLQANGNNDKSVKNVGSMNVFNTNGNSENLMEICWKY